MCLETGTFQQLTKLQNLTLDFVGWSPFSPDLSTCLGLDQGHLERLEIKLGGTRVPNNVLLDIRPSLKELAIDNGSLASNSSLGNYALPQLERLEVLILEECSLEGKKLLYHGVR